MIYNIYIHSLDFFLYTYYMVLYKYLLYTYLRMQAPVLCFVQHGTLRPINLRQALVFPRRINREPIAGFVFLTLVRGAFVWGLECDINTEVSTVRNRKGLT